MALNNKVLFYLLLFLCSLFFCSGEEQDILVLDIEKAKELAIISSEELQYLKLKMLGSWQGYRLGLRQFFPSVDLSFNQSDTVVYYDADTRNKQFSLSFTQLLCDGGRTLLQRRLARLDLYYGEYEYQKKEEEILDSVWELFYKILIGFEKMRLQEELYNVSLEQLEISRVERELGSITEIDLVETEIALKDLEIQMMQTEIEMDSLLYDFKRLLNLGAYDEIELAGSIDSNYSGMDLIQDSEYWFSLMKMENEEIKKMEYELQKKVEQIKMANRSFFPKIEAELSLFILDETFPLQNRGYNLSFSFSFPLKSFPISSSFQMGQKSEEDRTISSSSSTPVAEDITFSLSRKMALIDLEMERVNQEGYLDNVWFEIEQFIKEYDQYKQALDLKREKLELLKKKLIIAEKQLEIGELKRIDFLEDTIELFNEEIAILEAVLSLIQVERSFEKTIGLEPGTLSGINLQTMGITE